MTFLDQIVAKIREEHGDDISDLCIVVPTRRAVVFLREALSRQYHTTMWAPRMVSIQDFVRDLSGWQFPEALTLIFELYQVYMQVMRKEEPGWNEPFEQFYAWGEMLIKDFDEVDKYLVDAEKLFTNVRDLKEIEAMFTLSDENLEELRRFWSAVRGDEEQGPSELQEKFLKIWSSLYKVYASYKAALANRKLAYDGMAYRYLTGKLQEEELDLPYRKVIFAGFNALSTAEEKIMYLLLERERASVYWDVDRSYFGLEPGQTSIVGEEPGKFIREYHDKWQKFASHLITHDMLSVDKKIYLTGVPLLVGQAQYLGNLLAGESMDSETLRRNSVVLADENLLFPTLYAMPPSASPLNITMGFPLKQTHVFHLLQTIMRMIRGRRIDEKGTPAYSHQEVLDILNNPYIKARQPEQSDELQKKIRKENLVFIAEKILTHSDRPELIRAIFSSPPQASGMVDYVAELFRLLLADAQERGARLEAEYIFQLYTQFNRFRDVLDRYYASLSINGFARLFREVMQRLRIPFEGEPLEGLQVMGFLETRVLDFDRIFILGSNEGNLPDTSTGNSFIPYTLRKGFGLPTFEEKDAIYAYHFYRLLQRADEVHLIYNTQVSEQGGKGEESRFIRQISHYFRDQPHVQIHRRIVATQAPYFVQPPIGITATDQTEKILRNRYEYQENPEGFSGHFSATALTTYMGCPLRFYYRYVAGIKESDEVEANMEANTFGSVLHNTMEFLYGDVLNVSIDTEIMDRLRKEMPAALQRALEKEELGDGATLRGKNFLFKGAIENLCKQILKLDAISEPFEVIHLEEEEEFATALDLGDIKVRLNGKFDRVDRLSESGTVRILDYKTGKVEFKPQVTVGECFEKYELKEAFQGYFYAYLYDQRYPLVEKKVGFYAARSLSEGILYLNEGAVISREALTEFKERLMELIREILTGDFAQTEEESRCRYCPYNRICNRH